MGNRYTIKMPQLSDTMTEGLLVEWEKKLGDKISRGDVVAQAETDKAIMDVEIFREGYLSGPLAPPDTTVPVGEPIGYLVETPEEVVYTEGKRERPSSEASPGPEQPAEGPSPAQKNRGQAPQPAAESHLQTAGPRQPAPRPKGRKATPYARVLARLLNVDIGRLTGTGPEGEIVAADIEAVAGRAAESISGAAAPRRAIPGQEREMTSLERAVAHNVQDALAMPLFRESLHTNPERLQKVAKNLGISFTVLLARACGEAIKNHPTLNNAYQFGDKVVERSQVDVGIAVESEGGGLVAPVLRNINNRELSELAGDWKELVERARKRRLTPAEYEYPTFMLSNLGMFGIEQFDAIPVPGASAILAVGRVDPNVGMSLTLSSDHRVINGAAAARYLAELKAKIEDPEEWLPGPGPSFLEGDYDVQVAVIGAGPGGEAAARELAEKGVSVALINNEPLPGGECLWRGCIPSKAWRISANRLRDRQGDERLGVLNTDSPRLDWTQLEQTRKAVMHNRGEMAYKADRGLKITYRQGHTRFTGPHSLTYSDPEGNSQELTFGAAVIATGAPAAVPPIPGVDQAGVETSDTIWGLEQVPQRLTVIGAGAIGLEMAQIFRDFGARVTVLEARDRVLAEVEAEIAQALTQCLKDETGLSLFLGAKVLRIEGELGTLTVHFQDGEGKEQAANAERVLVATGKRPVLEGLGLEQAGIEVANGLIRADDSGQTTQPHIYAVGDIIGGLMLAHTAAAQGKVAAHNLLGERAHYDAAVDSGVIFTRPEAAFVGLTEEQASKRGFDPVSAKTYLKVDAMAMIEGEEHGMIKLVADRSSQRILGVHLLADHADTLIGEGVMMVSGGLTLEQVAQAIHPHPTQTELYGELATRLLARLQRTRKKSKADQKASNRPRS